MTLRSLITNILIRFLAVWADNRNEEAPGFGEDHHELRESATKRVGPKIVSFTTRAVFSTPCEFFGLCEMFNS
jgi:hypothetical protein